MFKKLLILGMLVTSLFSEVREWTDENFDRATKRGLVVVEFWASWNEANKVTVLDGWDNFDAKVYRVNIDLYPKVIISIICQQLFRYHVFNFIVEVLLLNSSYLQVKLNL